MTGLLNKSAAWRAVHARRFLAVLLVLLAAFGGLLWVANSPPESGATVAQLREENARLRGQLLVLRQASAVDRQAYAEVEKSLRDYQDQVMELKQEVEFYRGILAPSAGRPGLRLQSFKVASNGLPRGYTYKMVLSQVLVEVRTVTGTASFTLQGTENGVPRELTLRELGQPGGAVRFRFKYFQSVEGDVELPEGFMPLRVLVRVRPGGGDEIRATFPWNPASDPRG